MRIVAFIIWSFNAGMFVGAKCAEHGNEVKQVREGRAEYYLDSNHDRQFRYKTK